MGSEALVQPTPEVQEQIQGQEAPLSCPKQSRKGASLLKGTQDVAVSVSVGRWKFPDGSQPRGGK